MVWPVRALGEDPNRGRPRFPVMPEVELSQSGPPSTVLAPESAEALSALAAALEVSDPEARRAAIVAVVARWPRFLDGWARLGELGRDDIERTPTTASGITAGSIRCARTDGGGVATCGGSTGQTAAFFA